jgi:SAM-dependent methyltransferase/uncharacterized protein YbaR (Trm112 family)
MKISSLEQLRCIQSHSTSACHGQLEIAATPVTPRIDTDKQELLEGLMQCRNCGTTYPVISGVAIMQPRLMSWCRENYHYIQSGAARTGCIGNELQHWLEDRQWQLGNRPADNYYETERWISIFTSAHYDSVSSGNDDISALGKYIESQPQVFEVAEQMIARQLDKPVNRALDVGTNVGGMALRLGAHAREVIGIDTAFNAILTARKIQCGAPAAQTRYRRYHDGHHYEERTLAAQSNNAEFVLASIFDLPFEGSWDLVSALNVIDVVDDPRQFLQTLAELVSEGGLLLLTSPYSWGSDDVPMDNWLGASAERPSAVATREAIEQLGFSIVDEIDDIPWVLREHQRWYRVFLNHCILARKQVHT